MHDAQLRHVVQNDDDAERLRVLVREHGGARHVDGARAALPNLSRSETPLGSWLRGLLARAHVNTVVVALAAKLARTICAVLRRGQKFEMRAAAVS